MTQPQLPTVLIIDDEVRSLETLRRILDDDFIVHTAASTAEAEAILAREWVQILLCDQRMPGESGVEFLRRARELWPDTIRMIISGYTDSQDIISAVNEAGIYHYITKPWHPDGLILTLKNAARLFHLQRENELLAVELRKSPARVAAEVRDRRDLVRKQYRCDDGIIRGPESPMNRVCERLQRVAPYDIPVLLAGESGTGKELAARALHYNSPRAERPFVVENCGALPDELLESELFGYKRGAFTGAVEDREGLFQRADGGTVFLDEIGDVSPAFQVKLLRVLQEGEVRPLGGARTRKVDVRVIAASNKELEQEVRAGRFREDLYYRLAAVTVRIPPLRERPGDIPILARALLERASQALGRPTEGLTAEALACMQAYPWPGNVREMQNEVRHMLVMGDGPTLGAELLSPRVLRGGASEGVPADPLATQIDTTLVDALGGGLKGHVEALEARILRETLIRHRWNKSRAAEELGLSRVGLRGKLERYGLERGDTNGTGA